MRASHLGRPGNRIRREGEGARERPQMPPGQVRTRATRSTRCASACGKMHPEASYSVVVVKNWIYEENLRPMLDFASGLAGYDFGDLDWDALTLGARETDVEKHEWFSYPLVGRRSLAFEVARDPGSGVAFVRVASDDGQIELQIEAAVSLMQTYRLSR